MTEDHGKALRDAGLLNVEFPSRRPPADLCAEHGRIWRSWWDYATSYDPRYPKDYGNLSGIMDCRTSHAERRAHWLRQGLKDLALTETICRSGTSPQCGPALGSARP